MAGNNQIVDVKNTIPLGNEIGLIVRDATLGQQTMSKSRPVVIASDQSPIAIKVDVLSNRNSTIKNVIQLTNTNETTILEAEVGIFHDLTALFISNIDGETTVTIREGENVAFVLNMSNPSTQFLSFNPPFPQSTINTTWTAQLSVSNTVSITIIALKNT